LQQRLQLGHPHRTSFHRDELDAGVTQSVADERVAVVLRVPGRVGQGFEPPRISGIAGELSPVLAGDPRTR
jgi:hypothetical protein